MTMSLSSPCRSPALEGPKAFGTCQVDAQEFPYDHVISQELLRKTESKVIIKMMTNDNIVMMNHNFMMMHAADSVEEEVKKNYSK